MSGDYSYGLYNPILYASDFWILKKDFIPLTKDYKNETTITLRSGTFSKTYFGF